MGYFGIPFRNGVPIGLGSIVGFGAPQEFSPSELFLGGTAGAWYDPSDLTTLFTTSAGTTQCAMPGLGSAVSVGLMLDKSQGLVLGSELVTNGDFGGGGTGWTADASVSFTGGAAVFTASAGGAGIAQTLSVPAGAFICSFTVSGASGGGLTFRIRTAGGTIHATFSTENTALNKTYSFVLFPASASNRLEILSPGGIASPTTLTLDNVTIKALPGNHAISFNDTTARPELRARVNLLTYSEAFSNAAWIKGAGASATTSKLSAIAGTGAHWVFQNVAPNARCVFSVEAQADTTNWVAIGQGFTTAAFNAFFDLTNGVAYAPTSPVGSTASIEPLGGGWFRCTTTIDVTAGGMSIAVTNANNVAVTYNAAGTEAINIRKADARPANIGANVPAYQRIADANTYDTSGFPLYLRFDGIDDSMYTPANLNLSGTDKVAVFAGVRKLSDAATAGIIVEFSAAVGSNNGAFLISNFDSSGIGGPRYGFWSKGTGSAFPAANGYAAPITNVVSGVGDISGDQAILRVNGAQVALSTADQGTGNYGTYPLYIGARNNSSLWFNGHLYSLVVAGSAVSAGNISATEQWVAGKVGLVIP